MLEPFSVVQSFAAIIIILRFFFKVLSQSSAKGVEKKVFSSPIINNLKVLKKFCFSCKHCVKLYARVLKVFIILIQIKTIIFLAMSY